MKGTGIVAAVMLVFALASAPFVLGWGVAYQNNEISLRAGQSYDFYTSLQNMEQTAKHINISMSGDTAIAQIQGSTLIDLQPDTSSWPVHINITLPQNPSKDRYVIAVNYDSVSDSSGITLSTGRIVTIGVTVNTHPACSSNDQCNSNQRCLNGDCIDVVCGSGYIVSAHECVVVQVSGSSSSSGSGNPQQQNTVNVSNNQNPQNNIPQNISNVSRNLTQMLEQNKKAMEQANQSNQQQASAFPLSLSPLMMMLVGILCIGWVTGFILYRKGKLDSFGEPLSANREKM